MSKWKIEYAKGPLIDRFKMVESDMVRVANANEDIWFCNYKDRDHENHFIPKFILARGTYLSIEKMEPLKQKVEPIIVDFTEEMKKELKELNKVKNENYWI